MLIRSIAPLRLGLAGGGTDVSPYSDIYGGAILNSCISLYAYTTIETTDNGKIVFQSIDKDEVIEYDCAKELPVDGKLDLLKGIYNRVVKDFTHAPLSFKMTTYVDAPPGSGLGTSSTLVVSALGAFVEWLKLPLGEYDIAHLAYEIERIDLNMAGGKQDQYAATFGGVNFMEFYKDDKVIVNPLRVKEDYMNELEHNLLLFYTETSRNSSDIIESQVKNVNEKKEKSVEAMHKLKEQAAMMKEALLKGQINQVGRILDFGWQHKKKMTAGISNPQIDDIYATAIEHGATGGKISGAGGGGFMIFYCPDNTRYRVSEAIMRLGGSFRKYVFSKEGLRSWSI